MRCAGCVVILSVRGWQDGRGPLHFAAAANATEAITALVEQHGCDPNIGDKVRHTHEGCRVDSEIAMLCAVEGVTLREEGAAAAGLPGEGRQGS